MKNFLVPAHSLFFGGGPPEEGGEGPGKNLHQIFFRTPKPEICSTLPHLFRFGRCKEAIFQGNHWCFNGYGWYLCFRAQRPRFVPAAVQRPPWPLMVGVDAVHGENLVDQRLSGGTLNGRVNMMLQVVVAVDLVLVR